MSTDYLFIHQTITSRINSDDREGWEFICEDCGYRACYTLDESSGTNNLQIIDFGNLNARHVSSEINGKNLEATSLVPTPNETDLDEEYWLTPELRQQIEAILKDF